ncbi:hypothetical protein NDU88_003774 [Pleurodeles waltl]|uniref:Uncharacterized protein n=1 Tax=Pleurodeles waltl TaxID=8319 RepID=A0AAV7LJF8_PLEWA|nr:hypothetical protein NDU88_003774 [Pleurodeles waltl]
MRPSCPGSAPPRRAFSTTDFPVTYALYLRRLISGAHEDPAWTRRAPLHGNTPISSGHPALAGSHVRQDKGSQWRSKGLSANASAAVLTAAPPSIGKLGGLVRGRCSAEPVGLGRSHEHVLLTVTPDRRRPSEGSAGNVIDSVNSPGLSEASTLHGVILQKNCFVGILRRHADGTNICNEGLDYSLANREKPYFILDRYA